MQNQEYKASLISHYYNTKTPLKYKKRKARESVPVTRPAIQGLRIAVSCRTSNAEAHAEIWL